MGTTAQWERCCSAVCLFVVVCWLAAVLLLLCCEFLLETGPAVKDFFFSCMHACMLAEAENFLCYGERD